MDFFKKLKYREKIIVALFAAAVAFSAYMKLVHQPIADKITFYKTQIRKSESQLNDLKVKYPSVSQEEEKIAALKSEDEHLAEKIKDLEKKLPSKTNTSQLIGEISRLARDIKLDALKQKITKDEGYSRIFLEIKFNATYIQTIRYIAAIESISPFLRVEEMEISEPKSKVVEVGGTPVRMVMSCLLGESVGEQVLKADETQEAIKIKRDILISPNRPAPAIKESDFKLEGITFNADEPTAIINGDVFRTNSEINGYKIKKILEDGVVLTDGTQDHFINLKH